MTLSYNIRIIDGICQVKPYIYGIRCETATCNMNKEYYISVGEPWDFESPDGQNIIKGKILHMLTNTCLVYKSNYNLTFCDITGDTLILTPRYQDGDFSNLYNNIVTINGSILIIDYEKDFNKEKLMNNSVFKIIGSIGAL